MHAGHYENTPESVDIMIRSSRNVINQLIAWGVDFRRDENGDSAIRKKPHILPIASCSTTM